MRAPGAGSVSMPWPSRLRMNGLGLAGEAEDVPLEGALSETAPDWAENQGARPAARQPPKGRLLLPGRPPRPEDWRDPRVGWGLILPENASLDRRAKIRAEDAPEPIKELLRHRPGSPVLRYCPSFSPLNRLLFLRDWQHRTDIPLDRPPMGTAPGQLPYYLLIAASPQEVPWELQYILSAGSCVGRLDLGPDDGPGDPLGRYVEHLLGDWSGSPDLDRRAFETERARRIVTWAVDHGPGDITRLLRRAIAERLHRRFARDGDLEPLFLDGRRSEASGGSLVQALAEHDPALVITTSHGRTGPATDPDALGQRLGLPVDQDYRDLDVEALLADWNPSGAIWFAHGCATAGSSGKSLYAPLFEPGSPIRQTLEAVASLGDRISPLPRRLLGAKSPLRAFVGQVEPTFDWTLRQPQSPALLTDPLLRCLYHQLYQPEPIGLAMRPWFEGLGRLFVARERARDALDTPDRRDSGSPASSDALSTLLYLGLAARDLQSTVILGDPTVCLPARACRGAQSLCGQGTEKAQMPRP